MYVLFIGSRQLQMDFIYNESIHYKGNYVYNEDNNYKGSEYH